MNTYYVDSLSLKGRFLGRVASQGALNAPWAMAIAPSSYGSLSGWMLVGDFGDGRISAFDATTHASLGQITDGSCGDLVIDGLLAITPGNGGIGGNSRLLYCTAGPDDETHGLFGVPMPVPEPAMPWLRKRPVATERTF